MGLGGISVWQLLIVLGIVILIFGTKKLRNVGSDLGGAVKNFKGAMKEGEEEKSEQDDAKAASLAHQDGDSGAGDKAASKEKTQA